jgi:alpha-1,3-rhamnosyltransferase
MTQEPLVSIIIPSYNHKAYINQAVESVIQQTYQNIELIVIDDGSTDGSNELLKELAAVYNFKYIHRPNKGLIPTLNEALSLISGEYFAMLGSDDYYAANKTELQVDFFRENTETALCYGGVTYINADGQIKKKGKTKHYRSGLVFNAILKTNFIPLPTVMLRTDAVKEAGGFDERFFLEDYPLWLKITKRYPIGYIKENLTFYRLHNSNVSSNIVKMIKEVERILEDWKEEPSYKSVMAKNYLRWFADLSKTGFKKETCEYMKKALPASFYRIRFLKSVWRYYFT